MEKTDTFSFEQLAESVREINSYAGGRACSAVNRLLTLRNWLIGCYIVEYEQKGKDRAQYGTGLLKQLEQKIGEKGLNETLFTVSRTFYLRYPQLGSAVTGVLPLTPGTAERISSGISATVSQEFRTEPEQLFNHLSGVSGDFPITDWKIFLSSFMDSLSSFNACWRFGCKVLVSKRSTESGAECPNS